MAFVFDGSSGALGADTFPTAIGGQSAGLTQMLWMRCVYADLRRPLNVGAYSGGYSHLMYCEDRHINAWIAGSNPGDPDYHRCIANSAAAVLTDNVWQHVCWTYAAGTIRAYIDGAEITMTPDGNSNWTGAPHAYTTYLRVGCMYTNQNIYWHAGEIDDVRIYNRALSAAEIACIYAARGADGITPDALHLRAATVPGAAISSEMAQDRSPAGNHLSLIGTPTGVGSVLRTRRYL